MSWTGSEILETGKYFDVKCPLCAYEIEFWKDEPYYNCREKLLINKESTTCEENILN